MTTMRVVPRVADFGSNRAVRCSRPNHRFRIGAKLRDHRRAVEAERSSVQIESTTYEGFKATTEPSGGEYRDICVETEVTELAGDPSSLTSREDVPATDNSEGPKFSRAGDRDQRQTARETVDREKSRGRSRGSVDRKRNCGDRAVELEEEKRSSWWKDGGQTILQFFARILSKRAGMGAEGPTDRVLPTGKRVKSVSRGNKSHNRRGRVAADGGIRLKRVRNGHLAYRNESATEDKSRAESRRSSIYVRQIQRTRDKNLRVVLLERELRDRLSKRDNARAIANGAVNIRQLSSPLC